MRIPRLLLSAICFSALALPSYATSLLVNGVCETGTCNTSDLLSVGQSTSSPFSFTYTFANSDRYQGTGLVSASFTPSYLEITAANISLTYVGNATGTASAADTLTIDFLQNFRVGASGSGRTGFEYISGDFKGAYSNASSVTGQGISGNGTAMQLLGPFLPPDAFEDSASNQSFTVLPITPLDFRDTVTFGAGSGAGATIDVNNVPAPPTSPVPEPSSMVLMGSGLFALANVARRARRSERPSQS